MGGGSVRNQLLFAITKSILHLAGQAFSSAGPSFSAHCAGSTGPEACLRVKQQARNRVGLPTLSLVGEEVVNLAGGTVVGADSESLVCVCRKKTKQNGSERNSQHHCFHDQAVPSLNGASVFQRSSQSAECERHVPFMLRIKF